MLAAGIAAWTINGAARNRCVSSVFVLCLPFSSTASCACVNKKKCPLRSAAASSSRLPDTNAGCERVTVFCCIVALRSGCGVSGRQTAARINTRGRYDTSNIWSTALIHYHRSLRVPRRHTFGRISRTCFTHSGDTSFIVQISFLCGV